MLRLLRRPSRLEGGVRKRLPRREDDVGDVVAELPEDPHHLVRKEVPEPLSLGHEPLSEVTVVLVALRADALDREFVVRTGGVELVGRVENECGW